MLHDTSGAESSSDTAAAGVPRSGGGEMGERVRSKDWTSTPVGSPDTWPQSLKATIKTLLSSRYPMVLTWGPEFTQFYNDAYSRLIGDKHPAALGIDIRITLAEAWSILGPMIEQVMQTGVANWTPALPLLLERSGYREESYFSVSHAPAEDDAGRIVGMLAVCSEVTQQILGDRRLKLLRDLASLTGEARSVEKTCRDIAVAIAEYPLDVPFALFYLRGSDKAASDTMLQLCGSVHLPENSAAVSEASWPLARACNGETVLVEDVPDRGVALRGGLWNDPVVSARVMPIAAASVETPPLGALVLGISPSRALDEGYISFLELLAGQVSVALRNARAHEEERRRVEALAELDRAKTVFFSNVSHEFRTPLTLMLGPVEEALTRPQPELAGEELEAVHRNGLRLLKLVNTLLDFSRIEAGRLQAAYQPTDLATMTAELASVFRSAIERSGLRLVVDCAPLPEPVYVDRDMWEKIVLNLLSNALKFTLAGEIQVSLRAEQDRQAILTVQDTGIGIPTAELSRVFDRFHRVEGARGRTHEGTGIGLALVKDLAELHGGKVSVQSVPGEGSTFRVELPLGSAHLPTERVSSADLEPLASTALGAEAYIEEALRWLPGVQPDERLEKLSLLPAAPQNQGRPERRFRLLVADDNADMREYLRRLLGQWHEVKAVADGEQALAAVRAQAPDLILSDVMMPLMDGFTLLQTLRTDPATRTIPIILLSARAGEEARVEGLDAGADDYLIKPFSARELVARVGALLTLSRVRQEAAEREQALRTRQEAEAQRHGFVRDVLSSVTEGKLRLCESDEELPECLTPVGEPLKLTRGTMSALRRRAQDAAAVHGFPRDRWQDLETAIGEAAMNAVVHAGGGTGTVCIAGDPSSSVLQVWIKDRGRGIDMGRLPQATLERGYTTGGGFGHGFWLILKTVDRVWLRTGPEGTTVVLEQDRFAQEPAWLVRETPAGP